MKFKAGTLKLKWDYKESMGSITVCTNIRTGYWRNYRTCRVKSYQISRLLKKKTHMHEDVHKQIREPLISVKKQ